VEGNDETTLDDIGIDDCVGFRADGGYAAVGLERKRFPEGSQDNVYMYEMIRQPFQGEQFTTNNLIVITTDGVLVADAQGSPADTARLVEEIKKLTDQPIKYVVLGSEQIDHTGGNTSFPEGVTFISHPIAKENFEKRANTPKAVPKAVIPTETVSDKKVLHMGKTEIQILDLGRAHIASDLVVYLPKEKVLFMSESYLHHLFPVGRAGYPMEWIAALKKAEAMDVIYYEPAHGFIDDDPKIMKEGLIEFRKALETVVAEAKRLHQPGGRVQASELGAICRLGRETGTRADVRARLGGN
jgi:glyoxylase-like metal-dependent hydrolase (beta-lactamase superfamily II)